MIGFARGSSHEKSIYRYQARLWILGDAVGGACWRKGYEACRQQMTVRDDRIRIDLSVGELMHLGALAHLGFKKMMPNDRGIEMHRFDGEDHALEGAHAVERLERFRSSISPSITAPIVLFERGLYWASGRSGVVNLIATHKWFNLAALKGRVDAIQLRREVAEMMTEVEIAAAQREARAWITAH